MFVRCMHGRPKTTSLARDSRGFVIPLWTADGEEIAVPLPVQFRSVFVDDLQLTVKEVIEALSSSVRRFTWNDL